MNIEQLLPMEFGEQDFVNTPYLNDIALRALTYIKAGFPVNLSGPAGTGKTTMALYLALKVGRPVALLHGNDGLSSTNLVGGNFGYKKRMKIDNYIHSVQDFEESLQYQWVEGMLGIACRNGITLIYDEFTRSRPEINNLLLSIVEEKVLSLPGWQKEKNYIKVHPEFRLIFTSNPEEYAGVHRAQIALIDRMINLEMDRFDRETEIAITARKSGLPEEEAASIVDLVRNFRESCNFNNNVSVRSSIRIAQIFSFTLEDASYDEEFFGKIVNDVLMSEIRYGDSKSYLKAREIIKKLLVSKGSKDE
ncbi:gas vesicle protein GvpN [Desulfotruncus alcoholivorax]|uniref:gas vesicle protein GvpN n=1 Tax=Desulfotruncus alcoholivorax TaxID=265477 RepID=UPI00042568A5|nr:gas vesicle protein GvpN [Desulfotruncus alcoholivorax]